MNGYIKIDRGIMDWEWWDDDKVLKLWLTILLMANWEEKKWHGKTIPRGSFWTSYETLSKKSGLTYKQVRTALAKLKRTGEVTVQRAHDGTLITVVKYEDFQDAPNEEGRQGAGKWADGRADGRADQKNPERLGTQGSSKSTNQKRADQRAGNKADNGATTEEYKNKSIWEGFVRDTGR